MLVKTGDVLAHHQVFLGLPNVTWLKYFPGFEETRLEVIPDGVSLIICRGEGFQNRYPEIATKLARL